MESIDKLIAHSDSILQSAYELMENEVERIARNFLKDNSNPAYKFTMVMGTYFFQDKELEIRYDFECAELEAFIYKYDHEHKITGSAMTFTTDGIKITDW